MSEFKTMPRLIGVAKIALALVAGLMVLLLIALACAVLFIEPDTYRPVVQRQLSAALGREVTIGRLEIGKSLYPTVAITGLQVANPAWASRPNLLSVSSASARLNLVALVRGEVEIGRIKLQGVDLLLERDRNNVGNWKFASSEPGAAGNQAAQLPGLDEIVIRDAQIGWRDGDGTLTEVRIERANATLPANKPLRIEARVAYRQVPIDANLTASTSLSNALSGQPVSASVALRALDARANLEISTLSLLDFAGVSINFAVNGQQLDALAALVDQPLPALGPYRVSGRTRFTTGVVRLDNLRLFIDGLSGKTPLALSRIEIDSGEVVLGREVATTAQLAGRLDASRFGLDVTTANLNQLVNATDRMPFTSNVMLEDFELAAEGSIRRAEGFRAFEVVTHAKGDVAALARLVGVGSFKQALLVDLSGRIEGDPTQIAATGLRGSVAKTTVSGDIELRPAPPLQVNGTLNFGSLDLADFEILEDEVKQTSERRPQLGPPKWINSVDADLRLRVEQIVGLPMAATGLSGHATVKAGRLEVRKFRGSLFDTLVVADAGLRWKDGQPHITASITMPAVDLAKLTGEAAAVSNKNGDTKGVNEQRLNAPLPVAPMLLVDADLELNIGEITGAPVSVESVRGSARLVRGRLRVPTLNFNLAGAVVQSTLVLDASRDEPQLIANVSAPRLDVAKLSAELKVDAPVVGTIGQATATLDTRGASLRSWMENAKAAARISASTLKRAGDGEQLTVERASAVAGPGADVRAEMHGQFGEFPLDMVVTGGRLVELLDEKPLWPKLMAELNTVFRKTPISLSAQSAFHALLSGRNVPVRAEMRSPNGYAIVAGTIADLREPARTPLDVNVSANAQAFQPLLGDGRALPDLPINASAKASLDNSIVSLKKLGIRAGEAELSGEMRMELKDRVKLTASLAGETLDLRPWIPAPAKPAPDGAGGKKLLPADAKLDRPFNLNAVRKIDAGLELKIRRLISHQLILDDVSLRTDLDGGRLVAFMSIAEGDSSLELQFDGSRNLPLVASRVRMTDLDLEALKTPETPFVRTSVPRITANLKFAGVGTTPREVYKTAKGEALVSVGPGQLARGSKPFMVEVISTDLVETLLPGRKPDDYTQMECAAIFFKVADGVASSPDGMAARFKEVDILGSGAINLETKEILLGFKVVRRRWFSFSFLDIAGDFARVGGTLDKPTVGLAPGGTLFTGGAAWATAGVSLLATRFWRKLGTADNPCQVIIESGRRKSIRLDSLIKDLPKPGDVIKKLPLPGEKKSKQ